MSTIEVAHGIVDLCKKGHFEAALDEHYSDDIVSVEPFGEPAECEGIEAVRAKSEWWTNNFEVHEVEVTGPFVNGDAFSVVFKLDTTNKANGQRSIMEEIAVYEVEDDKIVHERFFMLPK